MYRERLHRAVDAIEAAPKLMYSNNRFKLISIEIGSGSRNK